MAERQLKIQTNSLKRLTKECAFYEKEKGEIEEKLKKLDENKNAEDYESNARRTRDALEETINVIKDVRSRAIATYEKLQKHVQDNEFEAGELLSNATEALTAGENAGFSVTS